MNSNQPLILITGPAGAGKSTLSRLLANDLGKCVDIDIEHINYMIADSFQPTAKNEPDTVEFTKWGLSGSTIGLLVRHFQGNGYRVIVHGHVTEELIKNIKLYTPISHKILLLPDINSVISRDKARGTHLVMGENMVKEHYQYFLDNSFDAFIKVDSTDDTVINTLDKIKKIVNI